MSNKYNWMNVPKEVNWISTDWEGWKLYHTSKPIKREDVMSFESCKTDVLGYRDCWENSGYKGHWEDSLEQRPVGESGVGCNTVERVRLNQEFIDMVNDVCDKSFVLSKYQNDTLGYDGGYICIIDSKISIQVEVCGVHIEAHPDINITREDFITLINRKISDRIESLNKEVGGILQSQKKWLDGLK